MNEEDSYGELSFSDDEKTYMTIVNNDTEMNNNQDSKEPDLTQLEKGRKLLDGFQNSNNSNARRDGVGRTFAEIGKVNQSGYDDHSDSEKEDGNGGFHSDRTDEENQSESEIQNEDKVNQKKLHLNQKSYSTEFIKDHKQVQTDGSGKLKLTESMEISQSTNSVPNQCTNNMKCSFWDPSGYQATLTRLEKAYSFTNSLTSLLNERSVIESKYVKHLSDWCGKFSKFLNQSENDDEFHTFCYGEHKNVIFGIMELQNKLSDFHNSLSQNIQVQCSNPIKEHLAGEYHKVGLGSSIKEVSEIKSEFVKAQKPWFEIIKVTEKLKHAYFEEYRNLLKIKAKNDNIEKKSHNKAVSKANKNFVKATNKYNDSFDSATALSFEYEKKMNHAYEKANQIELGRLEVLNSSLQSLFLSSTQNNDPDLMASIDVVQSALMQFKPMEDADNWSRLYGALIPFKRPERESAEEHEKEDKQMAELMKSDPHVDKKNKFKTLKYEPRDNQD